MSKFTKGPWKWTVNKKHKTVYLEGPNHEVMRFERYGMQSAQPTFLTEDKRLQGVKAVDLACDIKGREHHASWHQGINHPDANLIAAAPDLYEALSHLRDQLAFLKGDDYELVGMADKALAKANGQEKSEASK